MKIGSSHFCGEDCNLLGFWFLQSMINRSVNEFSFFFTNQADSSDDVTSALHQSSSSAEMIIEKNSLSSLLIARTCREYAIVEIATPVDMQLYIGSCNENHMLRFCAKFSLELFIANFRPFTYQLIPVYH